MLQGSHSGCFGVLANDRGVRTAYFKGPGELKFEIEDPITNR